MNNKHQSHAMCALDSLFVAFDEITFLQEHIPDVSTQEGLAELLVQIERISDKLADLAGIEVPIQ